MRARPMVDPTALRLAREQAGFTQHELAHRIGVAGGERISRWELGSSVPQPAVLHRLAREVGVSPADLLVHHDGPADLRRLRWLAGLSTRAAAQRVAISTTTWSRWETGHWCRPLPTQQLQTVAEALGVPAETLLASLSDPTRPALEGGTDERHDTESGSTCQ